MNYSNMIEEKALKKTFIIATLVSTIVGTFTASIALHDKIKEKQEKAANAKKQQQGVDEKQDKGLEELKARLGELENKADQGKEVSIKDKKASRSRLSSRSRSRSRSRASSRRSGARSRASQRHSPMEKDDFAQATGRSKAMLEETYEQNVGQLGQNFAQGDLVTENALQKQVIDLQQVVISVLQGAVSDNRALTEDDMRQIIMAQDKARDGSISALNAQRDRLLAEQQRKEQGDKTWDPLPPAKAAAASERRETMKALPPAEAAPPKPWERQSSDRRDVYDREPVAAQFSRTESYRSAPGNARELHQNSFAPLPPRKAPKDQSGDPFAATERTRESCPDPFAAPPKSKRKDSYPDPFAPPPDKKKGDKPTDLSAVATIGAGVATAAATVAATNRTNGARDEPRKILSEHGPSHEVSHRAASHAATSSRILPDEPGWKPPPPPMGRGAADDGRSWAPSHAQSVRGPPPPTSDWALPPNFRRGSLAPTDKVPVNAGWKQDRPHKANSDPVKSVRARSVALPKPPASPNRTAAVQSPPLSQRSARGSPPPGPKTIKSLPAPPPTLFCRYAKDLQKDSWRPLDKAFSRTGNHACPACHIPIPVDTRDVWVLSTHFPKSSSNSSEKVKNRDYRMDARFVVKSHTADGRGHFACVLCDKWRDIDCICRDVDALVKHLGTAHTPDEFEKDRDLIRMKNRSTVKSSTGREIALA
ncbi:hypothetical protein AC579_9165 [Pseudocercospora musae]|uniref:C2H2-type domain-containing protein n=1 Tax=Pseudocercospora musae TaxID=113226 RepID=A0A139I270_9PEZI|nr:hypothetical protein AC579_9165 [Pseudocercospora musae]